MLINSPDAVKRMLHLCICKAERDQGSDEARDADVYLAGAVRLDT